MEKSSTFTQQGLNISNFFPMNSSYKPINLLSPLLFSPLQIGKREPQSPQFSKQSIIIQRQTRSQFNTPLKQQPVVGVYKQVNIQNLRVRQSPIGIQQLPAQIQQIENPLQFSKRNITIDFPSRNTSNKKEAIQSVQKLEQNYLTIRKPIQFLRADQQIANLSQKVNWHQQDNSSSLKQQNIESVPISKSLIKNQIKINKQKETEELKKANVNNFVKSETQALFGNDKLEEKVSTQQKEMQIAQQDQKQEIKISKKKKKKQKQINEAKVFIQTEQSEDTNAIGISKFKIGKEAKSSQDIQQIQQTQIKKEQKIEKMKKSKEIQNKITGISQYKKQNVIKVSQDAEQVKQASINHAGQEEKKIENMYPSQKFQTLPQIEKITELIQVKMIDAQQIDQSIIDKMTGNEKNILETNISDKPTEIQNIENAEHAENKKELLENLINDEFNSFDDEYERINKKIEEAIKLSELTILKLKNIQQENVEAELNKNNRKTDKKESLADIPLPKLPEEAEKGVSFTAIDYENQKPLGMKQKLIKLQFNQQFRQYKKKPKY